MELHSFSKKSSGIFIPNGDQFSELTDYIGEGSINDISLHLGYNPDQTITYFGDFDQNFDVENIIIEIFSCKIIYVLTKCTVTKLDKSKVDYFLKDFNCTVEFDSYNIDSIFQSGIENKSLSIEFLTRVLNLNNAKPNGIFYAKSLDLYLSFKDGLLIDFRSADGLSKWSRYYKQLNPDLIFNIEKTATKFWGEEKSKINNEINIQCDALSSIPDIFNNEYIQLHETDFGTINYFMLLVCHYEREISLSQFMEINHGRYKTYTSSNSVIKFGLDRFIYEFSADGSLINFSLK